MYECLVGYTPFYADEPVMTCRKILRWQQHLDVPTEVRNRVSPACLDFMHALLTTADRRLGKNGLEEIKGICVCLCVGGWVGLCTWWHPPLSVCVCVCVCVCAVIY
jgi:hypothetical protein